MVVQHRVTADRAAALAPASHTAPTTMMPHQVVQAHAQAIVEAYMSTTQAMRRATISAQ